jgi:hypothetical protein
LFVSRPAGHLRLQSPLPVQTGANYRSIAQVTATRSVATTVIAVSVNRSVSFEVLPIRAHPAKPSIIVRIKSSPRPAKLFSIDTASRTPRVHAYTTSAARAYTFSSNVMFSGEFPLATYSITPKIVALCPDSERRVKRP